MRPPKRRGEQEVKLTNLEKIKQMDTDGMADVLNSIITYCPVAKDGKVFCDKTDPFEILCDKLNSERYNQIKLEG